MSTILASVGMGGENRRRDVVAIQSMLQTVGISPGPVDGRCGRRTIGAIEQFQRGVIRRPDGRIDVRGPTIRQLAARSLAARTSPGRKPEVSAGKRAETMDAARTALTVPDKRSASPSKGTVAYWQERTLLPGPAVNAGLICPNSSQMMALLGDPNGQRVKSLIATESVGPFRATGLKPALHSLRTILAQVGRQHTDLYHIVGSNGMHVIRQTRKSQSYSNHALGDRDRSFDRR